MTHMMITGKVGAGAKRGIITRIIATIVTDIRMVCVIIIKAMITIICRTIVVRKLRFNWIRTGLHVVVGGIYQRIRCDTIIAGQRQWR